MTLLSALVRACDRMPDAPPFGYSSEKIGFCVVLNPNGSVSEVVDLRATDKKRSPKIIAVPQARKRTVGIDPNALWDKTAYALGVTAGEGKRTAEEHAAFRQRHLDWLDGTTDEGLLALRRFIDLWTPDRFVPPQWRDDLRDQNLVFRLESDTGFLHDRPAARELWRSIQSAGASDPQICLVTGTAGPVSRLHSPIKGVWGAQSSGASLISFNLDAFTSYGHEQGDNAPVSEAAAFAYTTALNHFLAPNSGHRLQIGDASTVFWADAADRQVSEEADSLFSLMFDSRADDRIESQKLGARLEAIRRGERLSSIAPELSQGVRFHVLGLAPNAARLSVRFYWENDFGTLTANYQRYLDDMRLDPPPRDGWPALWRYLVELAVQNKRENIPPRVAGEWMRAILAGTPYPLTLLSTALMRIRADGEVNALRAAILKAVLIRTLAKEVPVALDPANTDKGYVLGRLFAVYEEVQRAALGGNVNATIRDKFYGAASASPQKVFAALNSGSQNHFSKLRKQSPGRAVNLDKLIAGIMEQMDPSNDPIPATLNTAQQALFGIGYYHQRSDFFRKAEDRGTPQDVTE